MSVIIMILVVIAALFAIISGFWVALALITAISSKRPLPDNQNHTDDQNNRHDS
jgi:uncharacterized protein YneF (UPF0154 family)